MSRFARVVRYFFDEAVQSLRRSWKISAVACFTIGMSLFLTGGFLIGFGSLSATVAQWREDVVVVVYVAQDATEEDLEDLRFTLSAPGWVDGLRDVSAAEAATRFRTTFPRLSDLVDVWEGELFPPSIEASLSSTTADPTLFEEWLSGLRAHPAALMVEADQDWLDQLTLALDVLRVGGVVLGALFLVAAALTAASVLRLIAQMHGEEIAIMRLVGATEFYIRGPFYLEGLIQGLIGAFLAVVALAVGFRALAATDDDSLWGQIFLRNTAGLRESALLLLVGATLGLVGAILSIRRETRAA